MEETIGRVRSKRGKPGSRKGVGVRERSKRADTVTLKARAERRIRISSREGHRGRVSGEGEIKDKGSE